MLKSFASTDRMPQKQSLSQKSAYLVLSVAAFVFAWAVRSWLTTPEVNAGLWPTDINANVSSLLGGAASTDAVGNTIIDLSITAVFIRFAVCIAILATLSVWVKKDQTSVVPLQTAIIMATSSSWWALWLVGELGFRPAMAFAVGVLPLWVTATAAVLFWIWWNALVSEESANIQNRDLQQADWKPKTLLFCGMFAWVAVSYWMNASLYQQLYIPHGDSAMYEEHLWNVWHGKGFRSYLDQGLFLGEHVQMIHLLLLPLHMLWPSHLLLELAESVALASCAIPIYRLVVRRAGDSWAAAFMGLAWLLYFPMHFLDIAIDQKTFRPIALGLPFLFWLIEFVELKKYKSSLVCLILALSAKEDIALVTFPLLGVLAFQARRSKSKASERSSAWPGFMAIGSVVYLLLVVLVVIPWFRSGEVVHYSRYFGELGSSPSELVKTAISSPMKVLAQACTIQTALYGCVFLVPLAFLPIKRPLCLAAGIISFGMLSLLQFGDSSGLPPVPYHHFHAPLLVVVFWAAISGLNQRSRAGNSAGACARLEQDGASAPIHDDMEPGTTLPGVFSMSQNRRHVFVSHSRPRHAAGLIFCLCAASGITGSLMPMGVTFWSTQSGFGYQNLYVPVDPLQQERAAMADIVVARIPATARVAATDFIHTRLTHCERSYDYSKYLRKVNNYQPGVPKDTDFIVIDTRHKYSEYRSGSDVPELNQPDQWELLPDLTNGAFLILQRRP